MTSINEFYKLDYIESSGTQYIDTGVPNSSNLSVKTAYTITDIKTTWNWIFNGRDEVVAGGGFGFGAINTRQYASDYGGNREISNVIMKAGQDVEVYKNKNICNFTINGVTNTLTNTASTFTGTHNLYLFALNSVGSVQAGTYIKIRYCKIWDNGTLVRDFIPVCRKSDSVLGMYDLVNNVFYTNQGTGSFIPGAIKENNLRKRILPLAYTQLLYIESSGTQWIDTGTLTKQTLKISTKIDNTGESDSEYAYGVRKDSATITYATGTDAGGVGYSRWGSSSYINSNPGGLVVVEQDGTGVTINGEKHTYLSTETVTSQEGYTIVIFAGRTSASGVSANLHGKIFYFKIHDNNTLIRNLIPAKRNSDNVIGMYDTVTETFFTNSGSGTFTAGPAILTVSEIKIKAVPSTYTQLDCIQSSGTQYIDTGYVASSNTRIEASAQFNALTNQVSGIWDTSGRCQFGIISSKFSLGIGSAGLDTLTADLLKHTFIIDVKNKNCYVDNTSYDYSSATISMTNHSMPIFAQYTTQTSSIANYCKCKIYYCKIWDNDVLVRNFIPVKRNSDNVLGMYDTVTETFFTNNGTGTFIAGNTVSGNDVKQLSLPYTGDKYEFYDYIQSSGTQYIDTCYLASNLGKIEVDAYPTTTNKALFGARSRGTSADAYQCWLDPYISVRIDGTIVNSTTPAISRMNVILDAVNKESYINGTRYSVDYSGSIWSANMYLFTRNMSDSSIMRDSIMSGNIYYAKLWDKNGTLVRNLIPAKRLSDNAIGMYDTVEDKFYTNAGSGSFTAGNVVQQQVPVWTKYDLPSTYIRKNYLQSSGTQWIITGVTPTQNTKVLYSMAVLDDLTRVDSHFFGSRLTATSQAFDLAFMDAGSRGAVRFISNTTTTDVVSPLVTTDTIKNKLNFYITSSEVKVNDTQIMTFSTSAYTSTYPLWLFGVNNGGTLHNQVRSQKVWGCKIWDGTTLVRDFVPVQKVSNSEYGMYDLVTDTFYGNAGTGTFIGG